LGDRENAKKERKKANLDWKDYLAITIAALETVFLPLVIFIVIILILLVIPH